MTRTSRGATGTNVLVAVLQFPPANVLAPIPVGAAADFLLLAAVRDQDVVLTLPFPDTGSPGDTIQLLVGGQPVGSEVAIDAYFPDKDIPVPLPATARVTEGLHALNYKLLYRSGAGNEEELGPAGQQFIVDYTSPAGALPQAPVFAPDVVADAVTPERLSVDADGNEYLPGLVHSYFGQAAGDTLTGYIDGAVATVPIEVAPGGEGIDVELRYTRAALDLATDGRHDFTYDVVDRAGNRSARSVATPLLVRMHALIPDVLPPRVPAASDGLLDHADIHDSLGAVVEIPPNTLVLPGDIVIVTWGPYEADPRTIVAADIGQDPLVTIVVPYADVYAAWFTASAGADMRVSTHVTYRIMRGSLLAGEPKAPIAVIVNLSTPGGVDPDPETPENEALYAPTVYSSSGNANFIPIAEQQLDGVVEVAWTRADDGDKVFAIGDIVTVRYGATALASYTVTAADMIAAKPLRLILPVAAIAAEGVGLITTSYIIERRLAAGGANIAISPPQSVAVEDEADLPGELAEGAFPEMNQYFTLGPAEIKDGTAFVGDYTDRRAGDTIRFEFRFVEGNYHSPAETPIDARFHSGVLTLAADGDPVEFLIAEAFLNYRDQPPEQMHIHGAYHVRRGMGSEVHSPDTLVYLDCRGAAPPFMIDPTPVQIVGTATFTREAVNGEPPYTYVSSDSAIVAVPDEHTGLITGVADGSATITASDTAGGSGAYHVVVVGNEPFTIDGSPVTVTGTHTFTRDARGGMPPYTYVSDAPDVVAVPDHLQGIIQGVSDGSATITARDSAQASGTYPVTVVGNMPFSLDPSPVQIIGTDTFTRHAKGGVPPYTYASSASGIVSVPDPGRGLIQGVTDGLAIVTARDSAHGVGSYSVTVIGNAPFSVDTSPVQIIGTNSFTRRAFGGVPPYIYVSDTPGVVRVPDANQAIIQGVSDGNAFISVRDQAQGSGRYPVTVIGNTPFFIDPAPVTIIGTDTVTRAAYGGIPPYTYVSSAPGVASVLNAGQGVVRGVSDGEADITASDSSTGTGKYTVTVVGNTPFTLDTTPVTLTGAASLTRDASGGVPPYSYVSSAPTVVKVPNVNQGLIQGVSDGTAKITASDSDGSSLRYDVTVSGSTPFTIDTRQMNLDVGDTQQREASGGTPPYRYTSDKPAVATVQATTGVVTAKAVGVAHIDASDMATGSGSYNVVVTTVAPPLDIDPSMMRLKVGERDERQATGGTPPYTYRSSDVDIVGVGIAGDTLARKVGIATIKVSDVFNETASYPVTVTATIKLLRPEPDLLEAGGRIDIDKITHPFGLEVTVPKYDGMTTSQTISLICITPAGDYAPQAKDVSAIEDQFFFIPVSYLQDIVSVIDPANARFQYAVTADDGTNVSSPIHDVTFYSGTPSRRKV
jgi:uncharacterized protein YjdB